MKNLMPRENPTLYLYGAMSQAQVTNIVRAQCVPDEIANLEHIISGWRKAANLFREIESKETRAADNIEPLEIDKKYASKLESIRRDALFRNSFSVYPSELKIVALDTIVATQRQVSLPYIDMLTSRISKHPSLDELIDFCISPKQKVPDIQSLQNAENTFTFSSPSVDFRFLGGYSKLLTNDDLNYSLGGGLPVSALILFVGYGAGSINVLRANNRLILNNGFHRVYALRKLGVTEIPVVVQDIGNPDLEMAPSILGLTRDYLTKHSRPVMVKDFFVPDLTTTLRLKGTMRAVRVQWGFDQSDIAI
jgi:hypothetical protein